MSMRIIIDSQDKRMTVPVIDYLVGAGYEVHGICFDGEKPLDPKRLAAIHRVSRDAVEDGLRHVLSGYGADDILIAGNPRIIEAINAIGPSVRYLLPTQEAIGKANDKKALMALASALGIRTPRTLQTPAFPMIAKLNVSENTALKPAQRYRIIRSEAEMAAAAAFFEKHRDNLVLQEYVDGPARGVAMLLDGASNLVDFIVYERLLEYPVTGGPSSACRSIVCPELARTAYTLLRSLGWTGMAMVEFKGGALLEINPRFWGSLPLLFVAKSDFFMSYIGILQDRGVIKTPEQVPYKPGKTMVYFPQGLLSVFALLRAGKMKKAALGLLTLLTGKEGIFRLRHPTPFFNYLKALRRQKSRHK